MSVSCEPIRDRSGRRQAVAPLLTEAARRSINTQASHPGNGSRHGKKRTFFRRAIGWESFPARRQAGTSSLQTAGNGQNGSDFASRPTGPLSTDGKQAPTRKQSTKNKRLCLSYPFSAPSFSRSQPKRSALSGGRLSSTAGGRHLFTFQPAFRIHPILSGISTRETYRPSPRRHKD